MRSQSLLITRYNFEDAHRFPRHAAQASRMCSLIDIAAVFVCACCFAICLLLASLVVVLYKLSTVLQEHQSSHIRTVLDEQGDLCSQVGALRLQVAALETLAANWPCTVDPEQWLYAARQAGVLARQIAKQQTQFYEQR